MGQVANEAIEDSADAVQEPSCRSPHEFSHHITSSSKPSDAAPREFVWTKNSCARRPSGTKKRPSHPAAAAAAGPEPDDDEVDVDPSKCRRDFAEKRVMVNTDWVEKKLSEVVTDSSVRSAVPKGSSEVSGMINIFTDIDFRLITIFTLKGTWLVTWRLSVPSVWKVVGSTPPIAAT